MSTRIIRQKSKQYVTISNEVMRDKDLSLKAKGLYALVMSLPDDWDFTLKGICAISKENYTAVNSAIKELIEAGYCTREQARADGRITGYDYIFYDSKNGSPCLGFLNMENQNQYNNSINNSLNNNINPILNTNRKNKKSISNDIQKVEEETGLSFNDFYKLYPLKKSRQQAEKSWNRLSKADRQAAIDKLQAYIDDCRIEKRSFKHPSTYLNQRTWEDDFTTHSKVSFYDALPTDSEQEKKFKNWMRTSYPNIENTALPLSYGDFMSLYTDFGTEEIKNQLEVINANIGKYKYSDINAIIRGNLEDI